MRKDCIVHLNLFFFKCLCGHFGEQRVVDQKAVLSFYHMDSIYLIQVIRVGSKCLYLGSHLAGSQILKIVYFMYLCISVVYVCAP